MTPLERALSKREGWVEPTKKKQSAVKLGAKHAARVTASRTAKSMFGSGLTGNIAALIARTLVNKNIK